MKHINIYFVLGLLGLVCLPMRAANHRQILKSPDGQLELRIWTEGQLSYSLHHKGDALLEKSPIGLVLDDKILGEDVKVNRVRKRSLVKENIVSPHIAFRRLKSLIMS